MTSLAYLKRLQKLKRIARGTTHQLDVSALERQFISASNLQPGTLILPSSHLHLIQNDNLSHYQQALKALNADATALDQPHTTPTGAPTHLPEAIGLTGASWSAPDLPGLLLVSPGQESADCLNPALQPLARHIFEQARPLIEDFTLREPLWGRVRIHWDGLDLQDLHLFPRKFYPGPLHLTTTLDTPGGTLSAFVALQQQLQQLNNDPSQVLNPDLVQGLTRRALQLRERLGALARYRPPAGTTFTVTTELTASFGPHSDLYLFYNPEPQHNTIVHFGPPPLPPAQVPAGLRLINGEHDPERFVHLLRAGWLSISQPILRHNLQRLQVLHDTSARSLGTEHTTQLGALLRGLERADTYLTSHASPQLRLQHTATLPLQIQEAMVCPSSPEPLLSGLLSRLSWNPGLRHYHDTERFCRDFTASSPPQRRRLLQHAVSSPSPNLRVNRWLRTWHRADCEENSIKFKHIDNKEPTPRPRPSPELQDDVYSGP